METQPKNNIDNEKNEDQIREDAKRKALEKVKQKATIVNIEELAEAEARKGADAYMTESAKKTGFLKKIWKHTFFDEYYRQREINRVRKDIKDTKNIYSRRVEESPRAAHENAMKGISERFASEYEGTLSEGEEKKILDEKDPETVNTRNSIKNLINSYAQSKIDNETFEREKDSLISGLKNQELLKGANNYADNLFEIAQNARLAIEHGAKMEELDYDLDIIVGRAKSSLKTEAHFNWVDKGIDKMKKSHVGRFVSPALLSTAVGLAYSLTVGVGTKFGSSKVGQIVGGLGTLGVSVGVSTAFAAANESQRVALERKQHGIEMAEGGSFEAGDKRREQMERYGYKMENATDLTEKLHDLMFEKNQDGKEVAKDVKQEDLDAIFASLSEIEARNNLNQRNKIDLISYSDIGNVEKERTDLTILTARAKVELRKKLEGDLKNGLNDYKDFDSYLAKQTQVIEDSLLGGEKGINAQDKSFRRYKAGRVTKKALATAIGGIVIGGSIRELMVIGSDHVQGLFNHPGGATIQTPFEHLREWMSGNPSHMNMGHGVETVVNGHTFISPEGTSIINNTDGTIDILKGNQVISSHFLPHYDTSGALDAASAAKLGEEGILLNTTHHIINSTQEVTGNAHDWYQHHPGETIKVHHDGWYGNNTPMHTDPTTGKLLGADLNELQTHWGGVNGVNANGDAVLNISHMAPGGSFQDGLSVNAQEAMHAGKLMGVIYLDGATQGQGIPVPIGADGNIIFDHNNPIMRQLFSPDAKGHMQFHGKFLEIVQKMGTDKNGVEHIRPLGTLIGEGLNKIKDMIPSHQDIVINKLLPSLDMENPFFVPLVARKPLEPVTFGKKKINDKQSKNIDKAGKISEKDSKDLEKNNIKDGIDSGLVIPAGTEKEIKQTKEERIITDVSQEEYDGMKDDIKMINRKVKDSEGIVTLEESDFKSAYGKKRYGELNHIKKGKDITFNKDELPMLGNELEDYLSKSKIIIEEKEITEQEKSKRAYEIYEKRLKEGTEGDQDSDWLEAEKQLKEERGNKKPKVKEIIKENTSNLTEEAKIEKTKLEIEKTLDNTKKEAEKEIENVETKKVYTVEDLSKVGTEFKSAEGTYTVTKKLGRRGLFSLFSEPKIEVIYKANNKVKTELISYNKKELEGELMKNNIEITKVIN